MIGEARTYILPGSRVVPADFCGNHFKFTPVAGQSNRIHSHDMLGCHWWDCHTAAGTFNWSTLDAKIAAWGGGPWTYCLFGTPTWASARPTEPHAYGLGRMAEPANMTHLAEYVTALLGRYPTIDRLEVWNEPDIPSTDSLYWFSGTVAKFVEMCQTIHTAAKAARPTIKITGPGTTYYLSSPNWLDAFFAAGGAAYLDEYSIHGYQLQWATPHKALFGLLMNLDYLQKARAKAGVAVKPISISEFGQINPLPNVTSDSDLIAAYSRAMVAAAAAGVTHANWYQYDDTLFGYNTRPAVVQAVADMVALLPGSTLSDVYMITDTNGCRVAATINGTPYVW